MVQTKSRHHKNENTFRFQTLNERLANISVDVTKRINRYNQKPEETETYFYQALEKWVDLNYTAVFHDFTINVKSKCQTLAMLIYHKDDLIVMLKEFILKADELSLQPILDLTAQLARDLQNDFYQYFPEIFKCIVKLLDTQNTEILEWSFQTLSYLFKFLWRYMLKNLDSVYELYSPLFDESRKYYIRNFAAESFAFLMRKIQNKNELFNFLLTQRLVEHPEELNGIGRLVFEMFKGIKHQFNVSMDASFNIVLEKLNFFESDEHKNDLIFNCIGVTVQSMAEFTKKEHTGIVWKCFYATIDKFLDNKKKITYLIRLIEIFLQVKQCYLIDNLDLFLDNMIKLSQINVDDSENSLELTRFFFDLGKLILTSDNVKFSIEKTNILPVRLYQEKYSFELVSNLTRNLFTYTLFETVILPNVISYFESQMKANYQSDKSLEKLFLALIAEYLLVHKNILNNSNQSKSKEFDSTDKFDAFIKVKGLIHINRLFQSNNESLLIKKMGEFFMSEIGFYEKNKPVETLIKALISAPFILKHLDLITPLINLINKLTEAIKSDLTIDINDKEMENFELKTYVFYLSIWSLSLHSKINFQNEIVKLITKLNEIKETQKSILNTNYDFISLDLASNHLLNSLWTSDPSKEVLKPVLNHLRNELSSPYPQNRINSLNLLSICYEKNDLPVNEESENLFDICLKIELTPASLDEYRHKIYFLQKLDTVVCTKLLNENLNQEVPLKYLFGLLYENFKLLWEPTIQLIQSYASSMKQNDFWNILCEFLLELTHKIECKRDQSKYRRVFQTESDQFNLMKSLEKSRYENMNNIDYLNNRLLLCKSMQGFASICEAKTKILVPLFFRFIK